MNALISPYSTQFEWCDEFFPEQSLCSLPLAGKPFLDHILDLCSLLKIERARILDYAREAGLAQHLQERAAYWEMELNYEGESLSPTLEKLLKRHNGYLDSTEGTLIFRGEFIPRCKEPSEIFAEFDTCDDPSMAEDGIYFWKDGVLLKSTVPLEPVTSLKSYFELNFTLLKEPLWCNLPGYGSEPGVFIGMDVAIKPNCDIQTPVMLGDSICLERDCVLRNGVIIGDGAVIDYATKLDHTLVMGRTFVGSRMEFSNMIIDGERIINISDGVYIDQYDVSISSVIRNLHGFKLCSVFEDIMLVILAIVGLPFYVIALLFGKDFRESFCWHWLSLDRYAKVWRALLHHGRLIRRDERDKNYVLCASEGFGTPMTAEQQSIDDLYYNHHCSIGMILRITLSSYINRLLSSHHADEAQ
jgi:hypothetical protein